NGGLDEPSGPQNGPDGEGAMVHVESPGKRLEQQRCYDQEIVPAHQDDLDIRAALEEPFQMAGRGDAPKAAAQDQNAFLRSSSIHGSFPVFGGSPLGSA